MIFAITHLFSSETEEANEKGMDCEDREKGFEFEKEASGDGQFKFIASNFLCINVNLG